MRSISFEVFPFLIMGAVNTVFGYLLYLLMLNFFNYGIAFSISYICGIFISYYLNSKFVFDEEIRLMKAIKFPLVYLIQYVVGLIIVYMLVEIFHVSEFVAPLVSVILTIPVTFIISRYIIKGSLRFGQK